MIKFYRKSYTLPLWMFGDNLFYVIYERTLHVLKVTCAHCGQSASVCLTFCILDAFRPLDAIKLKCKNSSKH